MSTEQLFVRSGQQARWQRMAVPLVGGALVAATTVALHVRDPHQSGSWGFCPWLLLTGTYCPGCGGLRAVNDLTNGDVYAAASSNLLFVALIPVILFAWGRTLLARWRGEPKAQNPRAVQASTALGVLLVVFWVVRNLPGMEWLNP